MSILALLAILFVCVSVLVRKSVVSSPAAKALSFVIFVALCIVTAFLFTNPSVTAGITTPILPVEDYKAEQKTVVCLIVMWLMLFFSLLALSQLFRKIVAVIVASIAGAALLEKLEKRNRKS